MELLGIIAEYDPFHRGHQYHIIKSKEESGCEGVVCVLSGDFVQRGGYALLDKFTRAEMAVRGGADLVIELPLPWCMAGAETFARGGVGLLNALGQVKTLSFGSECGDVSALIAVAEALSAESTEALLREYLGSGMSYAAARQRAVAETVGEESAALLSEANNILGIEYIKALRSLQSPPVPMTVKREGSKHNAAGSASELRSRFSRGEDISGGIPESAAAVFVRERDTGNYLLPDRAEAALLSRLRMLSEEQWHDLPDCSEGLENRLYPAARYESSVEAILRSASSKRYPKARMRRILFAAALGLRREDSEGIPPYIRPLCANEKGREILHELKKTAALPLLSRGGGIRALNERSQRIFELGSAAHDLWVLSRYSPDIRHSDEDFQKTRLIIRNL